MTAGALLKSSKLNLFVSFLLTSGSDFLFVLSKSISANRSSMSFTFELLVSTFFSIFAGSDFFSSGSSSNKSSKDSIFKSFTFSSFLSST